MKAVVLGSAAGGGVPQWNCACVNCQLARRGAGVKPRTQDSLAVSADGRAWFLLNASPDVARQIERAAFLQPFEDRDGALRTGRDGSGPALRQSPIAGAVLTNGDLDHCLGLLCLREWARLSVYATSNVLSGLVVHNALFRTLQRTSSAVAFRELGLEARTPLCDRSGESTGLLVTAFPVLGKVPLHLAGRVPLTPETNVGLIVTDERSGEELVYVPGAASLEGISERAEGADCLLLDGTFWSGRELADLGRGYPLADDMAHMPVGGARGSLERLSEIRVRQRVYTHINNTNPMLRDGSPERLEVEGRGWRIAEDGMEIAL